MLLQLQGSLSLLTELGLVALSDDLGLLELDTRLEYEAFQLVEDLLDAASQNAILLLYLADFVVDYVDGLQGERG